MRPLLPEYTGGKGARRFVVAPDSFFPIQPFPRRRYLNLTGDVPVMFRATASIVNALSFGGCLGSVGTVGPGIRLVRGGTLLYSAGGPGDILGTVLLTASGTAAATCVGTFGETGSGNDL
ncbi:MAG: hypothetical protein ACOCV0_04955 [Alkalispirochaeta sp.]